MIPVQKILHFLEEFAPPSLAESWDNVGLMTGDRNQPVTRVLCALDVTEAVLSEAVESGAELIVAHHPLIFTSVKSVTEDDAAGRTLRRAIRNNIAVICMHTNADCAEGGVNDALAETLCLQNILPMGAGEQGLLGRVGDLPAPMQPAAFAAFVKQKLSAGGVRFTDGGREISRAAVGGGACGKLMDFAVEKGAQAFVIGDCSYDLMQRAQSIGLTLIDAGHFPTETPIAAVFAQRIRERFPELDTQTSKVHKDCIQFL